MIGYVTLGTNDIGKARTYYDALLAELGAKRMMEFGDDLGGFTMWGASWDKPALAVTGPYDKQPATAGNGNMVALVLDTRAKVDALYAKALELGGSDEGAPGLRGEEGPQAFYGAYFRDPEGNKFCAFCTGPAS
jgi:catechol 2,3-dioxygenase-like lactoylglutathione lyase family enzyme